MKEKKIMPVIYKLVYNPDSISKKVTTHKKDHCDLLPTFE